MEKMFKWDPAGHSVVWFHIRSDQGTARGTESLHTGPDSANTQTAAGSGGHHSIPPHICKLHGPGNASWHTKRQ